MTIAQSTKKEEAEGIIHGYACAHAAVVLLLANTVVGDTPILTILTFSMIDELGKLYGVTYSFFEIIGEGDIRNCFGKLNDPGKLALRRLGILPQQLRTSSLFLPLFLRLQSSIDYGKTGVGKTGVSSFFFKGKTVSVRFFSREKRADTNPAA